MQQGSKYNQQIKIPKPVESRDQNQLNQEIKPLLPVNQGIKLLLYKVKEENLGNLHQINTYTLRMGDIMKTIMTIINIISISFKLTSVQFNKKFYLDKVANENEICLAITKIDWSLQAWCAMKIHYHKSGNFHVEIIHVVNLNVDLFSWVYGTHEKYFNMNLFQHENLAITIVHVLLIWRMNISL